jgi:hypothetical protein
MSEISDDYMRHALTTTRAYTSMLLFAGPEYHAEAARSIIWEHGRRNFALRAEGKLAIVCPVTDDTNLCGIGIFTTDAEETDRIMRDDPGVLAGVFTYQIHPCRSFPGDHLPPPAPGE